jgi:hypothetical protein
MPDGERIGGGFTEGELEIANFWVRNRLMLRRLGRGSLIAINLLVWGYALWGLFDAYVLSYPRESRLTAEIAQNQFVAQSLDSNRPSNVQTGTTNVFQNTDGRLDFLVPVSNSNKEWWVTFTYRFNVSGEYTDVRSGFLLPGEKTYLGEFGFTPKTKGGVTGVLTVDNISWHRLDPAQVGADYPGWVARRNKLSAKDVTFSEEVGAGGTPASRSHFTFANDSAYGFWNVKLYVVLKRGGSPAAATTITLDRLLPGEQRPIDIDWFEKLPSITDTEIVPVVNYLDESVYLPSSQIGG